LIVYFLCDREVVQEYNKEILNVTNNILELLSEGLKLKSKTLKSCLGGEDIELEMKINMYPPCPQPELALGVEPHTDMSALTLLVSNDVPGLQVWKDNNWVAVNYLQNALFVHIGDQLEVKTCHNLVHYSISFMKNILLLFFYVMVGVEQWEVQECFAQKLGEQGT
jgi:isopenicillin N synthase-like dioxygenase